MDEPLTRSLHQLLLPDTVVSWDSAHRLIQRLRDISEGLEMSLRAPLSRHPTDHDAQPSMEEPCMTPGAKMMPGGLPAPAGEEQAPTSSVIAAIGSLKLSTCLHAHAETRADAAEQVPHKKRRQKGAPHSPPLQALGLSVHSVSSQGQKVCMQAAAVSLTWARTGSAT